MTNLRKREIMELIAILNKQQEYDSDFNLVQEIIRALEEYLNETRSQDSRR